MYKVARAAISPSKLYIALVEPKECTAINLSDKRVSTLKPREAVTDIGEEKKKRKEKVGLGFERKS